MENMRLQKYLAKCGLASRRKAEEIIRQGRVKVNGNLIKDMGYKLCENDQVEVDDKLISLEEKKVYIILNKPCGYVSTVKDQFNRMTVLDLISEKNFRLYPVGRLDYDTSGLLILTNDGDFAYEMTHPKHKISKTYIATIRGIPTKNELEKFENGLEIDNYITSPAKIKIIEQEENETVVEIVIYEGKNRQVRKMCEKIGHKVLKLERIAIGSFKIGKLKSGDYRYINKNQLGEMK